jgi:hypothetical protein
MGYWWAIKNFVILFKKKSNQYYEIMYNKVTQGNLKMCPLWAELCPLYTGSNYMHYSIMGKMRSPFIYRDLLYRGALYIQGFTIYRCPLYTGIYYIEVPFIYRDLLYRCALYTQGFTI